jgi:hypothetical protein
MGYLLTALWDLRVYIEKLNEIYVLDSWPTMPGYDQLIKGIAYTADLDEDAFWMWFENHCTTHEELCRYVSGHATT